MIINMSEQVIRFNKAIEETTLNRDLGLLEYNLGERIVLSGYFRKVGYKSANDGFITIMFDDIIGKHGNDNIKIGHMWFRDFIVNENNREFFLNLDNHIGKHLSIEGEKSKYKDTINGKEVEKITLIDCNILYKENLYN